MDIIKKFTLIIVVFITINVLSQNKYKEAKILLKDSIEVSGLAKISGNIIKFKKSKKDKKKKYNYRKAMKLTFKNGDQHVFKISNGKIILPKIETLGKISLFSIQKTVTNFDFDHTGNNTPPRSNGSNTFTIYYFGRDNSYSVTALRNKKSDEKIYNEFFKNCKVFVDLSLEEKQKFNGMKGTVEFYNENCK